MFYYGHCWFTHKHDPWHVLYLFSLYKIFLKKIRIPGGCYPLKQRETCRHGSHLCNIQWIQDDTELYLFFKSCRKWECFMDRLQLQHTCCNFRLWSGNESCMSHFYFSFVSLLTQTTRGRYFIYARSWLTRGHACLFISWCEFPEEILCEDFYKFVYVKIKSTLEIANKCLVLFPHVCLFKKKNSCSL